MIKIATLFGSFEGKNRASAIDEYVKFHASKEKPLPKIKSIIEDGDNLDEAEIQDYQEEAQEAWDNYMGEPTDDSDFEGHVDSGDEAISLMGGR